MYTTINSSSTKILGALSCFNNLVLISFNQTYLDSFTISIYKDTDSFDDVDYLDMDAALSVSFSFRGISASDSAELMIVPDELNIDSSNWIVCLARRMSEIVSRSRCNYDSPVFINFQVNDTDLADTKSSGMLHLLHVVQEVSQRDDSIDSIEVSAGILSALAYKISYSSADELVSDSYNEDVSASYLFSGKTDLVPSLLDAVYSLLVPSSRTLEISSLADTDTQLRSLMFGIRDMIDPSSHVCQTRKVLAEENDRFSDVASLIISDDLAYIVQAEMEEEIFISGWGHLFNGKRHMNSLNLLSKTIGDFQGIRERTDMIYYIPLVLAMNSAIYSSPVKNKIDAVIEKYDNRIASAARIISEKSTKYDADKALIEVFLKKVASLAFIVSESDSSAQRLLSRLLSRVVRISSLINMESIELDFTNSVLEYLFDSLLLEVLNLLLISEEDVLKKMREDLTEILSIILSSGAPL